ncbi:MAG: thiamine-phosphate kinase [Pyrinomonadaceae bacterium]
MRDEGAKGKAKRGTRPTSRTAPARKSSRPSATPNEFDFIKHIRQRAHKQAAAIARSSSALSPQPSALIGIGDDAAVIAQHDERETVITTDLLVEDIDFRRATMPARALGHKALAISLSDIAAMGARPRWALLSVGVPADVWRTRFLNDFYAGFFALAARTGVALIGGDVSRTPERIVIDSIVLGEVQSGCAVLRSGARAGDQIFVTGALGGAAAGLHILEDKTRLGRAKTAARIASTRPQTRARAQLIKRQQQPEPRLGWGALLGAQQLASALIDLSDGLSSDLAHLCRASGVGALVEAARLPIDPRLAQIDINESDALNFALHSGEDFELLFTVPPQHVARLPEELDGVPVTRIGEIRPRRAGLKIISAGRARTLQPAGFTHFHAK